MQNKDNLEIKIKYHADIEKLEKIEIGDWIDLRCAEDVTMKSGEYKLINLGVSMKLPEGYEAHVAPRSSTFKNFGIIMTNSIGVIDNSYCGDNDIWRFPALCLKTNTFENGNHVTKINKGDRICQFRVMKKQPNIRFEEVAFLDDEDRGGIGSTGV